LSIRVDANCCELTAIVIPPGDAITRLDTQLPTIVLPTAAYWGLGKYGVAH